MRLASHKLPINTKFVKKGEEVDYGNNVDPQKVQEGGNE